ncbi:MAG TPA: condensation domain-containing protein, partial [Longimicrobium sp.]|nr:condensation domain-containing protein [Longimicrobium sp.]
MGTEAEAEQVCTLSAMQQGLFFNSMLAPGSGVDMVQFVFDLPEEVEPARMLDAWQRAADRHPILRSSFHADGGGPAVLRVRPGARVPFAEHDWRTVAVAEQEGRLRAWLLEDRGRGVEFGTAPLLRLNLFRMQDRLWRLVWSWHHALLDGHSVFLLVREVFATYEALGAGESPAPPPAPSFAEYIDWARAQDTSAAEGYWRGLLAGFAEPLPLPLDHVSTLPFLAENYHEQLTHLEPGPTRALRALAREHGLTPNTVVQGAWAILLARYTGTCDVVFGNIRSGRRSTLASAPEIVGPLISNVPVRVRLPEEERLLPWLQALRAQHVEVRRFEHSPLVDIQSWSEVPRGTPLFQTGIVFDNSSLRARFQALGGAWERRGLTILRQPNVPLAVGAYFDAEDRLTLRLGYYVDRLEHATVERMLGHFRRVLEEMVARPDRRLGELDLMEDGERERVVHAWSRAVEAAAPEATAHALVSAQALRTPDAVALEDSSGARLTYAELER